MFFGTAHFDQLTARKAAGSLGTTPGRGFVALAATGTSVWKKKRLRIGAIGDDLEKALDAPCVCDPPDFYSVAGSSAALSGSQAAHHGSTHM